MTNPLVSVVMGVFNCERFLREALESILNQSFHDFEFVVVDDGSSDGSASILDSYEGRDARLRICHRQHAGLAESLNYGCSIALGKYIARMDADDIAVRDRLMWQVDYMETHPQVGVLGGAVEYIDSSGRSLGNHSYPADDRELKAALAFGCPLWHPTVLFRREILASTGGYRAVVVDAEDYDLWLRVADQFDLANLERVLLKYRIHPHQVSVRKSAQQVLGILAAQLSANARKHGNPDPLDSIGKITPESLAESGVPLAQQRNRLASYRMVWIRRMCAAGELSAAVDEAVDVLRSDLEHVDPRLVSDLRVLLAGLYWKQDKYILGLRSGARAIVARPIILARPFRPVLQRIGLIGRGR